jgi:hypothetical protein
MKRGIAAALAVAVALATGSVYGGVVGFEEDFALAADRGATLKQLIPGTEEFYYYTALNQQNSGDLKGADATIAAWVKQLGRAGRVEEMENRQALLKFSTAPGETVAYLARVLNLQFNHQKETSAAQAALPTALDPKLISRETLTARALANNPQTLGGFENHALGWLTKEKLSPERLHELLSRLTRPDDDRLVDLVWTDLSTGFNTGFGSLAIHRQMLLAQLDALVKAKPELLNDSNFVTIYVSKLRPATGVDLAHDRKEMGAYLDRLWGFVSKLGPQHNSLKANVLYQRLVFDRKQGVWDKDRFLEYLKLPRQVWYVNPKYMESPSRRDYAVNLGADYSASAVILRPIQNDEALVRSYLLHLLVDAENVDAYKPYLESTYLTEAFAEAKILAGVGDQDKWAAMLPASKLQAIKDRVELEFSYTNQDVFAPPPQDDKVSLAVQIKNVKTLIVKVYEINAANFYKTYKREVNTDIDLDGLVANEERTVEYTDSPLRRIERTFEFEKLKDRGVYVVEFIGNGKSSRALVRKGKLRYLERENAAGHVFTVLDEANKRVDGAKLWMAGHEYLAERKEGGAGEIQVPFSTSPTVQPIVLEDASGFASLDSFTHRAERYRLEAGIHVSRESLIKYGTAKVVIRPALFVNSTLVSPKLLEEVALAITSTDQDGISATKEVPDFELFEDQASTYEFQVPDRLKTVSFTLKAKVQNVSLQKKEDLSVSKAFTVNEIDATDKIEDLHISKVDGEYVVEVLGKTGEAMAGRMVYVSLKHRDFKEQVHVTLKSDAEGRVKLGALEGIETVFVKGVEGLMRVYHPGKDDRVETRTVNGAVGETLRIPYMGHAASGDHPPRSAFSLLEVRGGGTFVADRFDALTVSDGFLEIKGLPAGVFDLQMKEDGTEYAIRMAPGEVRDGWVLSSMQFLQVKNRDALQIVSVKADDANVTVQLANAGKNARVHVFATRFVAPAGFSPFGNLAVPGPDVGGRGQAVAATQYESGRSIGDEYRYIIDRRYAAKYPGNMLARPGLLLNPWAIRSTDTGQQEAKAGDLYRGGAPAAPAVVEQRLSELRGQDGNRPVKQGESEDVDFLAEPSAVLVNLKADEKGVVTIARKDLGAHQDFYVVAVDAFNTVYREVSIAQPEQKRRDLRMADTLDVTKHFTEQKQVTVLEKGQTITMNMASGSNLESYDTLAKAYRLYSTLKPDATLAEFNFILRWPSMKDEEKREKYSKYACHELNYFLYRKDEKFFEAVVLPYLKNKKDKTFMDHFLLGDDLSGYETPWTYGRLNVVERVLLGQRIAAEKDRVSRQIKEQLDLVPPDVERFNYLFKTALGSNALSKAGAASLVTAGTMPVVSGNVAGISGFRNGAEGQGRATGRPAEALPAYGAPGSKKPASAAQQAQKAKQLAEKSDVDALKDMASKQSDADMAFDMPAEVDRKRLEMRQLYRKLDKTMEYAENNYYHVPIEMQVADLVKVNPYWRDLAEWKGGAFLSKNLAEPAGNFTEIMFALSVLDLPFDEPKHESKREGGTFTLTAGGPLIAFHKEIKEADVAADKTPILVSQNYFRYSDRYTYVDNERADKYVTEEFLTHVVYGCQVVITNPTSSRQKLDAMLQLPKGAMPVLNAQYTRGLHLELQPYETKAVEYAFYFPAAGEFRHYPVQVAKNEKLVASAPATVLKVVETPSKVDTTSWEYISQNGTNEQVIDYLKTNNIERVNLDKIAWRMRDKDFFEQVIGLLRERHVYANTLWSYSVKHQDAANMNEFLQHQDEFVAKCGEFLDSPVLKIDPAARHSYQHLEYLPLVNARTHRLGKDRQVLNDRFFAQYENALEVLRYHPALSDEDRMAAAYYLLLQERVDDGLKMFKQVDREKLAEQLQYDYVAAYADFYGENAGAARAIAEKYKNYPVDRWRKLFEGVIAQADEIEGKEAGVVDKEDRNQQQNALATTEPTLELKVEAKNIVLAYRNVEEVRVNYYLMDFELMFSQSPFMVQGRGGGGGSQFSMIKSNETGVVKLDAGKQAMTIPLPEKFLTQNVMVEVVGGGQTKSQAYYANSLDVQVAENYGQLTVVSGKTGKALPKAYVKVYARMSNGGVRFYKDGYTDLRGKFDYTSLSTDELENVGEFSILVLSETDGGMVRTAAPPKR